MHLDLLTAVPTWADAVRPLMEAQRHHLAIDLLNDRSNARRKRTGVALRAYAEVQSDTDLLLIG